MHIRCVDVLLLEKYNMVKEGVDVMATTNITMRIDEELKSQLQELVSNLGMDMTTFLQYQQNRR